MRKVYIVGAKRTAIGTFQGTLKDVPAVQLGVAAAKAAMEQANVKPEWIDETIIGNILMAGQGMGPGRQVSIHAGVPAEKPGYTVNMLCGSGMKAIMIGAVDIMANQAEVVLAGGMESMDTAPYLLPKARFGYRLGDGQLIDHMVFDGLTDVFNMYHMGITAENLAEKYGITREEQDLFAYKSQMKAKRAIETGRFKDEIVPFVIKDKKVTKSLTPTSIQDLIQHSKYSQSSDQLSRKDGTVTAGNASGINDGASATVLASEDAVKKYGLKPLAEIVAFAQHGVDPSIMGIGPVGAISKALKAANLKLTDIQLIELNEAFAAQSLAVLKDLKKEHVVTDDWLEERVNVNGGAIALGHPIGASGNRITVTLLYEMKKRKLELGLASLCIGGGMGTALIIRNIE